MDIDKLLIVDIQSIPQGLNIDVWLKLVEENNLVLWDSYDPDGHIVPQEPKAKKDVYRIVNLRELGKDERDVLCKTLNIDL